VGIRIPRLFYIAKKRFVWVMWSITGRLFVFGHTRGWHTKLCGKLEDSMVFWYHKTYPEWSASYKKAYPPLYQEEA
jgi:hypothetical protein